MEGAAGLWRWAGTGSGGSLNMRGYGVQYGRRAALALVAELKSNSRAAMQHGVWVAAFRRSFLPRIGQLAWESY